MIKKNKTLECLFGHHTPDSNKIKPISEKSTFNTIGCKYCDVEIWVFDLDDKKYIELMQKMLDAKRRQETQLSIQRLQRACRKLDGR